LLKAVSAGVDRNAISEPFLLHDLRAVVDTEVSTPFIPSLNVNEKIIYVTF
jgi:hypothetical protein